MIINDYIFNNSNFLLIMNVFIKERRNQSLNYKLD